jgi:WD40 repeat protein
MDGDVGAANHAHVTFSKDGTKLAAGGGDKRIHIWKVPFTSGTPTERK